MLEWPSSGFPNSGGSQDLEEIFQSLTAIKFRAGCRLWSHGIYFVFVDERKPAPAGPDRRRELVVQGTDDAILEYLGMVVCRYLWLSFVPSPSVGGVRSMGTRTTLIC